MMRTAFHGGGSGSLARTGTESQGERALIIIITFAVTGFVAITTEPDFQFWAQSFWEWLRLKVEPSGSRMFTGLGGWVWPSIQAKTVQTLPCKPRL